LIGADYLTRAYVVIKLAYCCPGQKIGSSAFFKGGKPLNLADGVFGGFIVDTRDLGRYDCIKNG
jgi:hypothetical protein